MKFKEFLEEETEIDKILKIFNTSEKIANKMLSTYKDDNIKKQLRALSDSIIDNLHIIHNIKEIINK